MNSVLGFAAIGVVSSILSCARSSCLEVPKNCRQWLAPRVLLPPIIAAECLPVGTRSGNPLDMGQCDSWRCWWMFGRPCLRSCAPIFCILLLSIGGGVFGLLLFRQPVSFRFCVQTQCPPSYCLCAGAEDERRRYSDSFSLDFLTDNSFLTSLSKSLTNF
jgi:hypothetical protein